MNELLIIFILIYSFVIFGDIMSYYFSELELTEPLKYEVIE